MIACGLDFGTSNSAIGVARSGGPELAPLEDGKTLIPSAVFFDYESKGRVLFGGEAIAAYVGQTEGRLMRALKTILGSPLIGETTVVGGRKLPLSDVVGIFVRHLKSRAEAFAGTTVTTVVHGRPVRFVDGDDAADARAQAVLQDVASQAGFRDIQFVYEPLAAAYDYERTVNGEEMVLVADIGGGTSDFSVIRIGPQRHNLIDRSADILATAGVRVGGTDFDTDLSLEAVMPLLGLGTRLVDKDLPMPRALYHELATWATINFVYTYKNERELAELAADAVEPNKVERLLTVVRRRLGHRIAFAAEDAKIALSTASDAVAILDFIEQGLAAPVTLARFERAIRARTERLHTTARGCIAAAGLGGGAIDTIFFTGGSSRVPAVRAAIARAAPTARATSGSDLMSVAMGLTHIASLMR
jgi:hypothetical chaperone protein